MERLERLVSFILPRLIELSRVRRRTYTIWGRSLLNSMSAMLFKLHFFREYRNDCALDCGTNSGAAADGSYGALGFEGVRVDRPGLL